MDVIHYSGSLLDSNVSTYAKLLMIFLLACTASESSNVPRCNGSAELCDRALHRVAFAGAHNAMSSAEDDWIPPNHLYDIQQQLQDGIRGLNLDTYLWEDQAYLCHGFCELGATLLVDELSNIKTFIDTNPDNVLLITFQSALDAEATMEAFEQSGLLPHLYPHALGEEWPTLGKLVERNQQLVVFSNTSREEFAEYHSQWTHWVDNPYSAQRTEDFSCDIDRGEEDTASLFNVNHFLTNPVALQHLAVQANEYATLKSHVFDCWNSTGRFPNQVLVDFYSIGSLFRVVDELNTQFRP